MAFRTGALRVKTPSAEGSVSQSELRALALSALALALLSVAGLASSVPAWHTTRATSSVSTTALRGIAAAGGVVLVVALLVLWVETPATRRLKKKRPVLAGDELGELGGSFWTAGKALAVILLALAVVWLATVPLLSAPTPTRGHALPRRSEPVRARNTVTGSSGRSASLGWLLFPIAVAFMILTPAAVLVRRRRLREGPAQADDPGALERAVRASIAELEAERDPRRAIVRAYGRMEQAFRDVEIVRARGETASEFLGRTTRRLPVSAGAAAILTERFEEVRYSTHEVTEADREQALASLRRVERELVQRP